MRFSIHGILCFAAALLITGDTVWAQNDQTPQPPTDGQTNSASDQQADQSSSTGQPQANADQQQTNADQRQTNPDQGQQPNTHQQGNAQPWATTDHGTIDSGLAAGTTYPQSFDPMPAYQTGQVYTLRYDANGREYICVNGCRIYFDGQPAMDQVTSQNQSDERYRAAFGNPDLDPANQPAGTQSAATENQNSSQQNESSEAADATSAEEDSGRYLDATDSGSKYNVGQQEATADIDELPTEPPSQPEANSNQSQGADFEADAEADLNPGQLKNEASQSDRQSAPAAGDNEAAEPQPADSSNDQ